MKNNRSSGILLHPTSLPGPFGIGDLGPQAYKWIDFLSDSGFSWWQFLPIGPTGFGHSPYQSFSSFAGNPMLISPQLLLEEGLLKDNEIEDVPLFSEERVKFSIVKAFKDGLLPKAVERLRNLREHKIAFDEFKNEESDWLKDYAIFMALKSKFGESAWTDWPTEYKDRHPDAIENAQIEMANEIEIQAGMQYIFSLQWKALRKYAREKNIGFVGDIPIYVAHDSVDVWLQRKLFQLDEDGKLTSLSGVPPDYFAETGQLWGNPLYEWPIHEEDNYQWWQSRLGHSLAVFDVLRLDHFRGFAGYWSVPAGELTAENGSWVPGPGNKFFHAMEKSLPNLAIIAEDLGEITPDVIELREEFDFPSMKILQFAFFDGLEHEFLPHNYPQNSVVYTGTHDHDTSLAWFQSAKPQERAFVMDYLKSGEDDVIHKMIKAALKSKAQLAIFPMQDILNLDSSARMNVPGTIEGNWRWRMMAEAADEKLSKYLRGINKQAQRV